LLRTLISDLPGGFGDSGAALPHRADAQPNLAPGSGFPPYLVLLRVGFTLPPASRSERCALTAPFHPYPCVGSPLDESIGMPEYPLYADSKGGMFSVALAVHGP